MKRITYWPQLFLGIVFNWGVILSYLVFNEEINIGILLIYLSAVFWTLGYDTIYGLQDAEEDIKIGVKSTSIKFNKKIKQFLVIVYLISISLMIFSNIVILNKIKVEIILYILPLLLLIFQIQKVEIKNSTQNLSLFKLNNYYGLSIFIILIIIFYNA